MCHTILAGQENGLLTRRCDREQDKVSLCLCGTYYIVRFGATVRSSSASAGVDRSVELDKEVDDATQEEARLAWLKYYMETKAWDPSPSLLECGSVSWDS